MHHGFFCVQQPPEAPGAAAPLPASLGGSAAAASAPGPGGGGLTLTAASAAQLASALQNAAAGRILLQSEELLAALCRWCLCVRFALSRSSA
jgi:hypothetical protein